MAKTSCRMLSSNKWSLLTNKKIGGWLSTHEIQKLSPLKVHTRNILITMLRHYCIII